MSAQIKVLAGRFRFPHEQSIGAIGRGQQDAVGTEPHRVDPIGVFADFVQQSRRFRVEKMRTICPGPPRAIRVRSLLMSAVSTTSSSSPTFTSRSPVRTS